MEEFAKVVEEKLSDDSIAHNVHVGAQGINQVMILECEDEECAVSLRDEINEFVSNINIRPR